MGTLCTQRSVRISLLTLALVGLLWLLLSAPAQAVRSAPPPTHIVVTVSTPIDEYDDVANGTCSLREAISTVNGSLDVGGCTRGSAPPSGPPTIILPSDTYTLTRTGANEDQNATGDLDIRQSVIISTTGALPATVAGMANWDDRIFHILTGTVTIRGIAIRGGHPLGDGGGLLIESGTSLTLDDSVVADNSSFNAGGPLSSKGGGILSSGILTLTNVTLSGNSAGRDLENGFGGGIYNSGTTTLNNSTLSGNSATTNGGGIYNDGTAMLNNSTLSGNSASARVGFGGGGGIYNYAGTATLNNSTLSGNSAGGFGGGGIFNDGTGTATLNNSTLSGNSVTYNGGGGILNRGTATLNNSTLSGNRSDDNGGAGGIYNTGTVTLTTSTLSGNSAGNGGGIVNLGTATLNNSTLSGNSARVYGGGGIYNYAGTATLNNSTLNGNTAGGNGGGIFNTGGTATLTNSTLSANSAKQQGGGIYNQSSVSLLNVTLSNNSATTGGALFMVSGYTTVLTNTILAYSPAGFNCYGAITASKSTISSDNSCPLTGTGDQPRVDPLLTALGNYGGPTQVHMLKLGSPAIDGVVGIDAPAFDQRGVTRPQQILGYPGGYDIGAVERQTGDSDLAPRLYLPLLVR
jgi:CSLREA domain-containing protein